MIARVLTDEDLCRPLIGMAAMMTQCSHRFINSNLAQSLRTRSRKLIESLDESERIIWQTNLEASVKATEDFFAAILDKARGVTTASKTSIKAVVRKAANNIPWSIEPAVNVSEEFFAHINEEQVAECLTNLLDNAKKAVCDRAKEIARQGLQYGPRVSIHAALCDAKEVMIQIDDNGVGMGDEELEQAIGGWFTTRGGSGAGILIAALLAELNDGRLEILSTKGTGTTVRLYLPTTERQI